jgi:hypothetical protein
MTITPSSAFDDILAYLNFQNQPSNIAADKIKLEDIPEEDAALILENGGIPLDHPHWFTFKEMQTRLQAGYESADFSLFLKFMQIYPILGLNTLMSFKLDLRYKFWQYCYNEDRKELVGNTNNHFQTIMKAITPGLGFPTFILEDLFYLGQEEIILHFCQVITHSTFSFTLHTVEENLHKISTPNKNLKELISLSIRQPHGLSSLQRSGHNYLINILKPLCTNFPRGPNPEKLLAHFLGDSFINGTNLQGLPPIEPAIFLSNYLRHVDDFLAERPLQGIYKKSLLSFLDEFLDWQIRLNNAWNENDAPEIQQSKLNNLAGEMIESLKINGHLLIPGGWKGSSPAGHALLYHIVKEKDGSYTFKIYNTGDGVSEHVNMQLGGKRKFLTHWTLRKIEDKEILSEALFSHLLSMLCLSPEKTKDKFNPQDIYHYLLHTLQGRRNTSVTTDQLSAPLNAGTCSAGIWMALLHSLLSKEERFALKYRMRVFLLALSYFDTLHTRSKSNQMLFIESGKKFSRSLAKYHRKGYISERELQIGIGVISTLLDSVRQNDSMIAQPHAILMAPGNKLAPPKGFSKKTFATSIQAPYYTGILPVIDAHSLANKLTNALQTIKTLQTNHRFEDLDIFFEVELSSFPEIEIENSAWSKIPHEEREQCAIRLSQFTQAYCSTASSRTVSGIIHRLYLYAAMTQLFTSYLKHENTLDLIEDINLFDRFSLTRECYTPVIGNFFLVKRLISIQQYAFSTPLKKFLLWTNPSLDNNSSTLKFEFSLEDPKKTLVEKFLSKTNLLKQAKSEDQHFPHNIFINQSQMMPPIFWHLWNQYFATHFDKGTPSFHNVVQTNQSLSYVIQGANIDTLWKRAYEDQLTIFKDPLLHHAMAEKGKAFPASGTQHNLLTYEQIRHLEHIQRLENLRVPETLRFFQENQSFLQTEEGKTAFIRLLFSINLFPNEPAANNNRLTPFLSEIARDENHHSLTILKTLLLSLSDYAIKNRDFSTVAFIDFTENLIQESLAWHNSIIEASKPLLFENSLSEELLKGLVESVSLQELIEIAPWYFERAVRRGQYDTLWLTNQLKISFLLAKRAKDIPNREILSRRLQEGRAHLVEIIGKADLSVLMKELFRSINIPHPAEFPIFDRTSNQILWGDFVFELYTGLLTKRLQPVHCLEGIFDPNHVALKTILREEEHCNQFLFDEKRQQYFLPNQDAGIQLFGDFPMVFCYGRRLKEIIQELLQHDIGESIDCNQDYLFLEDPFNYPKGYPQIFTVSDDKFSIRSLLFSNHQRYQRWVSQNLQMMVVIDIQSNRAFAMHCHLQHFEIQDLANDLWMNPFNSSFMAKLSWIPEDFYHAWIWRTSKESKEIHAIELPRFNLRFDRRQDVYHCEQHKGFYLGDASNPMTNSIAIHAHSAVPNVGQVISLKNDRGDRLLLVPETPFCPASPKIENPLDPRLCALIDSNPCLEKKYFLYFKESDNSRILPYHKETMGYTSSQPKAVLFLAGLHFQAHNYRESLHYLKKIPTASNLGKEEIELFLQIIDREKACTHPNHRAVLLHFIRQMLEAYAKHTLHIHAKLHPELPRDLYNQIGQVVLDYTSKVSNIDPLLRIPDKELGEFLSQGYAKGWLSYFSSYFESLGKPPSFPDGIPLRYFDITMVKLRCQKFDVKAIRKIPTDFPEWHPKSAMDKVRPVNTLSYYFPSLLCQLLIAVKRNNFKKIQELKASIFFLSQEEYKHVIEKKPGTLPASFEVEYALLHFLIEKAKDGSLQTTKVFQGLFSKPLSKQELPGLLENFIFAYAAEFSAWTFSSFPPEKVSIFPGAEQTEWYRHKKKSLEKEHYNELNTLLQTNESLVIGQNYDLMKALLNPLQNSATKTADIPFDLEDFFTCAVKNDHASTFPLEPLLFRNPQITQNSLNATIIERLRTSYYKYKTFTYTFKDTITRDFFITSIQNEIHNEENKAGAYQNSIVKFLNNYENSKGPSSTVNSNFLEKTSELIGDLHQEKAIEDALDWMMVKEGRPETEKEKIFFESLHTYLLSSLKLYHLKLIAKKAEDPSASQHDLGMLASQGHKELQPIDDDVNRILLYFEYKFSKLLKPKQFDIMHKVLHSPKTFFQLGCGEGKTKILTALFALLEGHKNNCVVNIVPSGNFATNVQDLQHTLLNISHRLVHVFHFDRKTALNEHTLTSIHGQQIKAWKNRDVVISEPQSIQSLLLCYQQHLDQITKNGGDEAVCRNLLSLENLLKPFLENSTAIMDEVDLVLKPTHYLNYALDEEIILPAWRWEEMESIYSDILQINQEIDPASSFPIASNYKKRFSTSLYRNKQLPLLAAAVSKRLVPAESIDLCCRYLCCEVQATPHAGHQTLENWLHQQPEALQQKLRYVRAQLQVYLPHTLKGRLDVQYGFSDELEIAIPYNHNKNPAKSAKFQKIDVLINYTYQLYLNRGLSQKQIISVVQGWQAVHKRESRLGDNNTLPNKNLKTYLPDFALEFLNLEDTAILKTLHHNLSFQPAVIFEYLHTYLLPQLTVQKEKMSSSAQDLGRILFKKIIAFSGTPSHYLTYPVNMECHFDETADGEAMHLLLNTECTNLSTDEMLLKKPSWDYSMIIDPQAFYEGQDNCIVAQNLLAQSSSTILYALFFDKDNKQRLIDRRGKIISANEDVCPPSKRITYCDQQHSTGTDIEQPINSQALLLINQGLTLTDLIQGCKRMRQWGKGQKIDLWSPSDITKEISAKFGQFDIPSLILWCLQNETNRLAKVLLPSHQDHIHSIYRSAALRQIIAQPTIPQKVSLFHSYRSLFIDTLDLDEYVKDSSLYPPEDPFKQFQNDVIGYKELYSDILSDQDLAEQNQVIARASKILAHMQTEKDMASDRLNGTIQIEQNFEQENQEFVENNVFSYRPFHWDPDAIFRNKPPVSTFLKTNPEAFLSTGYTIPAKGKHPSLFLEPLSRVLPKGGFDPTIYATENFFSKREKNGRIIPLEATKIDRDLFEKYLPPVKYFLQLTPKDHRSSSRYIILGEDETNKLRGWMNELSKKQKAPLGFDLSLHDVQGVCWEKSSPSISEKGIERIQAQLEFLNGETVGYHAEMKKQLKTWIEERNMVEKMHFFQRMQKLRRQRWHKGSPWEGTTLQQIFREVQEASTISTKSSRKEPDSAIVQPPMKRSRRKH